MLSLLTQSISNASFGIYFPKFTGTIYELLSAPVSYYEVLLGYVGAAATKSMLLGLIILATAGLFVPVRARKSVVSGKSVSVRVDLVGRRIIKKTTGTIRTPISENA